MDQGRTNDARSRAREAISLAHHDFRPDDEAAGESVLAIGWLAEGNLAEAQRAIARADKRLRITEDRLIRLSGGIAAARVRAAVSGSTAEARRELDALSREADGLSAVALAFEARLALGEIEMRTGDASTGRARLTALEREAAAKGFVSLARRAAAAAR